MFCQSVPQSVQNSRICLASIYVCYSMSLYLTILMCVGLWCVMWCEGSQGPGQGPGCLHTTSHTTDQHISRWSSTKTYSSIHILKPDVVWKSELTRGRFCETFSGNWLWNIGHVLHLNFAMSWVCLPYPNDHLCPNNFVSACSGCAECPTQTTTHLAPDLLCPCLSQSLHLQSV